MCSCPTFVTYIYIQSLADWFAQDLKCTRKWLIFILFIIPDKVSTMILTERWRQDFAIVRLAFFCQQALTEGTLLHLFRGGKEEERKKELGTKISILHSITEQISDKRSCHMLISILCSLALFYVSELRNRGSSLPMAPVWRENPLLAFRVTPQSRDSPVIPSPAHGVSWWPKASGPGAETHCLHPPHCPTALSYLGSTENKSSLLQLTK